MVPGYGDAERLARRAANIPETSSCAPPRTVIAAGRDDDGRRRARRAKAQGRPVEITIDRLIDYSDDEILDELRRVARLVRARELTVERFAPLSRVSHSAIHHRFGCWKAALLRAGLGERCSRHWAADRRCAAATNALTDRQIVRVLRGIARRKKSMVLIKQDVLDDGRLSVRVLLRRFGPWSDIVAAAGLRPSRRGQTCSRQACIDNLVTIARHKKRLPRREDLRRPPSKIGRMPYVRIFGSWRRALRAFIERIETSAGAVVARAPQRKASDAARRAAAPTRKRAGRRRKRREAERKSVTLTMRYQILARDRFRCQACGNSPATDPACKLHVDHVVPFARGGRTTPGNLRALCAACNIGKRDGAAG